jgi:hypothetical protein
LLSREGKERLLQTRTLGRVLPGSANSAALTEFLELAGIKEAGEMNI